MRIKNLMMMFVMVVGLSLLSFTSRASSWGLYGALGPSYSGISAMKVLYNNWEWGQLTTAFYGGNKIYRSGSTYASFGLGYTVGNTLGFFGSVGFDYKMFWDLGLRGEIFAVKGVSGYGRAAGQLGLSYRF